MTNVLAMKDFWLSHIWGGTVGYETIVANDFPMQYSATPPAANALISTVENPIIKQISQDFPPKLLKRRKARELTSEWRKLSDEEYLQIYQWDCDEVPITVAGAPGQQNLGAAVAAGKRRRIQVITVRHTGTNNTVLTVLLSGGATKVTIDVPAQTTRVWSEQPGIRFQTGEQPAVQSSDITGGSTYVRASGIEA